MLKQLQRKILELLQILLKKLLYTNLIENVISVILNIIKCEINFFCDT